MPDPDAEVADEYRVLAAPDGAVSDLVLSEGAGLLCRVGSMDVSRDMPGKPRRPASPGEDMPTSSLLLRYAAEFTPLSAVCLNHDGSLEPSDAAICSRLFFSCSTDESLVGALSSPLTTELGRLVAGRRWFHVNVPDRARLVALCLSPPSCAGDGPVPDLLTDPKPLNSGTSFVGDGVRVAPDSIVGVVVVVPNAKLGGDGGGGGGEVVLARRIVSVVLLAVP